jgi:hypothetical protein
MSEDTVVEVKPVEFVVYEAEDLEWDTDYRMSFYAHDGQLMTGIIKLVKPSEG